MSPSSQSTQPPPANPNAISKTGTCFAVGPNGTILTAYHVINGATNILVQLSDGTFHEATLQQGSASIDLAVLQLRELTLHFLNLAIVGAAQVGDHVFTVGYPAQSVLGHEPKYTDGSISSLSGPSGEATLMQISVPVQPGNSGGPLVNERGQVIGIITSTAAAIPFLRATGGLPQNVNWAVKAEFVQPFLQGIDARPLEAANLSDAIARAQKAICLVEVTAYKEKVSGTIAP